MAAIGEGEELGASISWVGHALDISGVDQAVDKLG
jgi:hypothetical protein